MIRIGARPLSLLTSLAAVGVAAVAVVPAADAAGYRSCPAPSLNRYAAGFVELSAKGTSCSRAVTLAGRGLRRLFADGGDDLRIGGYRCRVYRTNDASDGGDPSVEYLCVRGAQQRIRVLLVN